MAYSGAWRPGTPPTAEKVSESEPETHSVSPPTMRRGEGGDAISNALAGLFKKIETIEMETDDLILALILYLMYRESGDKDLLIMLGAMLLS
ncbi:MAG: hypothetical protein LUH42_07715 [Oscillospiraceae bacterium]|nr:hypothetical protein [Oscillospiraceae bacterium]